MTTTIGSSPTSDILPAYQGPFRLAPTLIFVQPAHCGCEAVPAMTEFDYSPAPRIRAIIPSFGNALGQGIETIDGSGFNILTYEWTNFGPAGSDFSQDFNLVAIAATAIQVQGLPIAFSLSGVGPQSTPTPVSVQTFAGLGVNDRSSPFAYAGCRS